MWGVRETIDLTSEDNKQISIIEIDSIDNDFQFEDRKCNWTVYEEIPYLPDNWRKQLEVTHNTPLSPNNKGYQMLLKMGYKEGKGLGKHLQGITEPLNQLDYDNRSGVFRRGIGIMDWNSIIFSKTSFLDEN